MRNTRRALKATAARLDRPAQTFLENSSEWIEASVTVVHVLLIFIKDKVDLPSKGIRTRILSY